MPVSTVEILRDVRRQIVVSTRPEPYKGHKAEVLKRLDENIEYFTAHPVAPIWGPT